MSIPTTHIDLIPSAEVDAGEVFCGSLDSPLSNDGLKGLKKAVRRKSGWDVIVSSPKQRCAQFAEWVAQKHDIPLQHNKSFREMDFGDWEGNFPHVIMQESSEKLLLWWSDPALVKLPKGESFAPFKRRVLNGWQQLLRKHKGKQILLITHPGVLRIILSDVMAIPSNRFFSIHIEHGTTSRIRVIHDEGGNWSNLVAHGC
ncbi:MAG: histidine phosphatase family protein [Thiolinea sp.]